MHKHAHPEKLHERTYTLVLPDDLLIFCCSFISATVIKCPDKMGRKGYKSRLQSIMAVTALGTLNVAHIISTVKNTEKN